MVLPGDVVPIPATIIVIRRELLRVLDDSIGPEGVGTQSPGPLGGLAALHSNFLPLSAGGVQHAAEAVAVSQILRGHTVEQLINGGARKLHRGRSCR